MKQSPSFFRPGVQEADAKKVLHALQQSWENFNHILLLPTLETDFSTFLHQYRGLPSHPVTLVDAQNFIEKIVGFFSYIFQNLPENIEKNVFDEIESSVNLSLYYWCGNQDRNYQFRTIVHFYQLEGKSFSCPLPHSQELFIGFSEYGLKFYREENSDYPKIFPASFACGLNEFCSLGDEITAHVARTIFSRLRTLQREIFLITDEWEHLNALLAVEYTTTFRGDNETEKKNALQKLNARRDFLALWCVQSFEHFQDWLTFLRLQPWIHSFEDILAEVEAAERLVLSSTQKIFLPASISRHRYCDALLPLLTRWAQSRLQGHPEDFATLLTLQALRCAQGIPCETEVLRMISQKSYEWQLSFDPIAALQSFCYRYTAQEHLLFCSLLFIAYAKKLAPKSLAQRWISQVTTLIEMPHGFPHSAPIPVRDSPLAQFGNSLEELTAAVKKVFAELLETEIKAEQKSLLEKMLTLGRLP